MTGPLRHRPGQNPHLRGRDAEESADALTALADRTPWTDVSDHGNAAQRVSSLGRGAWSGVTSCPPGVMG
ncbi:hypothetical protein [Streptomyces sp. SRF1]|uniref:hypothetical protein n=1 Tax=Streptomyces sp. SRF1 TaxID=1549642 RepID=UPI0025AF80F0|nr:hypothetical protein [Streptomyces sp. SRF1]